MKLRNLVVTSGFLLLAGAVPNGFSAAGTISTSFDTVSPISLGQTFTVTLRLSGYTDTFEIDSWNLRVSYDQSLFQYVAGSASFGSAGGPDPQWLSKPNQTLDLTYSPSPFSDEAATAGTLFLSLTDLGLLEFPDRGSLATDGFLVSFSLMGTSVGGPSAITPMAPLDGNVFFDSSSLTPNPGGAPSFSAASMQVVPEPRTVALMLAAAVLVFVWQRKRRRW
jgi:hypothetical protein